MLANEALLNEAVIKARPIEGEFRGAVASDLLRAYGPEWRNRLPESLLAKWGKQREAELELGRDRGPELIEYASLLELLELVHVEWDVFSPRFEEAGGKAMLDEFRVLRNPLMHGHYMSVEDCERIIELAARITVCCNAQVRIQEKEREQPKAPLSPAVEPFLSDQRKKFYNLVVAEMESMSGRLMAERQALTDFLLEHKRNLSFSLLEKTRAHFSALEDTEQVVNRLGEFVPPRRPPTPGKDWKLSEWLKWAGRAYLPYRRWMIKVDEEDEEIETFGLDYESWLKVNYPQILMDGSPQLVANVYQQIQKLFESNCSVLWLIIDNLADYWLPKLHNALHDAGFTLEQHQRMLSMLPSVTDISRRAMCAGRLPRDAVKTYPDDATAFAALWEQEEVRRPRFCRTVAEAWSAIEEGAQLIALVFNRLDHRTHKADDGWFSAEEDIENEMRRMLERASGIARTMNSLRPTKLVISTDHGCIKPAQWSETLEIPPSAIPDEEFTYHRRYAVIDDDTGLNPIDWHVLDAESFQLPRDYAVPRGQRFIGGRPRGFTHGGLTPEETVVQYLVATPGLREDEELAFFVASDPIRLGQPSEIAISVSNPFVYDVEEVIIRIPYMDLEFAPFDLPALSQVFTEVLTITLPKDIDVHEDKTTLPLTCEYTIGGSRQFVSTELKIDVLTLYSSDLDDFEGLFDV